MAKAYRPDLFTDPRHFFPKYAFRQPQQLQCLSWFYQSLPLLSFILYSFLHYRIDDHLQ